MAAFLGQIADKITGREKREAAAQTLREIEKFDTVHETGEAPLGKRAGIVPATKPGEVQRLYVAEKLFAHGALGDNTMLFKKCRHTYKVVRGSSGEEDKAVVLGKTGNKKDRVVVFGGGCDGDDDDDDDDDNVLAVLHKNIHVSVQNYHIYGTGPAVSGQRPSSEHHGRKELYLYGTARKPDKSRGDPEGRLLVLDTARKGGGGPHSSAYGVEQLAAVPSGEGLLTQPPLIVRRMGEGAAILRKGRFVDDIDGPVWDCKVAPGIDPLVVLGLIAFLDEQNV